MLTLRAREAKARIDTVLHLRRLAAEAGLPLTPPAMAEIARHRTRLVELVAQLDRTEADLVANISLELART